MKRAYLQRYWRTYLVVAGILGYVLLAIWTNAVAPSAIKVILTVCSTVILSLLIVVAYRHAMQGNQDARPQPMSVAPPITKPLLIIPPEPAQPPRLAPIRTAPILYDYPPKPVQAVGYSLLVAGILVVLWFIGAYTQTNEAWVTIAVCSVIAVTFCYWQWVKWGGINLIITEDSIQLQRSRPWPLKASSLTIPNKIGAVQDVRQTLVDRLLGTCRLFSDTDAKGDEAFHNIKWLPHPEELRLALKHVPLRKTSWLPFSRKNS